MQFQENTNVSKKVLSQSKNENLSTVSQGQISKEWPNILNYFKTKGKIMLYTNLLNTNAVETNDMTVGIEFPNGINAFGKTVLEKAEKRSRYQ